MKRRSVRNDPISAPERDRGAVVVMASTIDITKAEPVRPQQAGPRAAGEK
ncbi:MULTISPECIES: hypothetical protein [unclassified Streptomyces]|nr:hypothetical protein [Streptomyces sp. HSG2]